MTLYIFWKEITSLFLEETLQIREKKLTMMEKGQAR